MDLVRLRRLRPVLAATLLLVSLGLLLAVSDVAEAEPISFRFVGTVTRSTGSFENQFDVGDPVLGFYTFESTQPDLDSDPQLGHYSAAVRQWRFAVGSTLFELNPVGVNVISVGNDTPDGDFYQLFADLVPALGFSDLRANWLFRDPSGQALSSDALPLVPPPLSAFAFESAQVFSNGLAGNSVSLEISSLTRVAERLPEPSPLVLFTTGLAILSASCLCLRTGHSRRCVRPTTLAPGERASAL
jgi:hypothetical protein